MNRRSTAVHRALNHLGKDAIRIPGKGLIRSRDRRVVLACLTSGKTARSHHDLYWSGLRRSMPDRLNAELARGSAAYLLFGAGESAFLIPWKIAGPLIARLNHTDDQASGGFWHVQVQSHDGCWELIGRGGTPLLKLNHYRL